MTKSFLICLFFLVSTVALTSANPNSPPSGRSAARTIVNNYYTPYVRSNDNLADAFQFASTDSLQLSTADGTFEDGEQAFWDRIHEDLGIAVPGDLGSRSFWFQYHDCVQSITFPFPFGLYGCNSYSPASGRIYVFQSNDNFDPLNPTFDGLDIMTPIELSELTALNLTKVDPFAPNCYFYPASNLSLPLDFVPTRDTSSGPDFASVLSEIARRNVKETRGDSPFDMNLEELLTANFTRYVYVAFISEDPALISVKATNIVDFLLMEVTVIVAEPEYTTVLLGCFSGDSEVRVLDGESVVVKPLDQVQAGDLVESLDDQLIPTFSRVYYMIHEDQAALAKLLRIESEQSTLKISEGHLLYARSALDGDWELVQARTLRVGDWLLCANSGASRVKSIQQVLGTVRHPLTENHRIVVSGVAASVHVLSDSLYRTLTSPIRLADQIMPSLLHSALGKAVVNLAVVATDLLEGLFLTQSAAQSTTRIAPLIPSMATAA